MATNTFWAPPTFCFAVDNRVTKYIDNVSNHIVGHPYVTKIYTRPCWADFQKMPTYILIMKTSCVQNTVSHVSIFIHMTTVRYYIQCSNFCASRKFRQSPLAWSPETVTLMLHNFSYNVIHPGMISKYIHCKVWDEITYPFPNFNALTVKVWGWISNFIPHSTDHVITYQCWDKS